MILCGTTAVAGPALTEATGAASADITSKPQVITMRIRIHVEDKVFNATLADNETAIRRGKQFPESPCRIEP
jgi:hypothetical protein